MSEQKLWDKAYIESIAVQIVTNRAPDEAMTNRAKWLADESVKRRRESIAARSPEPEPIRPAKVKRGASTRQPCPGGGEKRSKDAGYLKCNGCGRVVGTSKGRGGWYAAEHKLPAEVGR